MAKNQSRRLKPALLEDDRRCAANLQTMTGYSPSKESCSAANVATLVAKVDAARAKEAQADAAAAAARDEANAAEWELHNAILDAKDQVKAQFGRDSRQAQDMLLTRTSERKTPTRSASQGEAATK